MFQSSSKPTQAELEYEQFLSLGELNYQCCDGCGHCWLPPREHCPNCLGSQFSWKRASGHGTLVSWVTYHRTPVREFKDRTPYNVSIVELVEGPRLITRVQGDPTKMTLHLGMPLRLSFIVESEKQIAVFNTDS